MQKAADDQEQDIEQGQDGVAVLGQRRDARGDPLRDVLTKAAKPDPDEYLAEMRRIRAMTPEPPPGQRWMSAEELVRETRDSRYGG